MYYYGNNGYYTGGYQNPCANNGFVGYTQGFGSSGAIWIVLFIHLNGIMFTDHINPKCPYKDAELMREI